MVDNVLRHPKQSLADKLQETAAEVFAYVFMVVFLPVITTLVYVATTGVKPAWRR